MYAGSTSSFSSHAHSNNACDKKSEFIYNANFSKCKMTVHSIHYIQFCKNNKQFKMQVNAGIKILGKNIEINGNVSWELF